MAEPQQRIVHFSGNVQGVGFRYTTRQTAQRYDVTGTVKNLADGRVRCVVEGQPKEIDAFVKDLRSQMDRYIRDISQQQAEASGKFDSFQVVH
jgi:acylphosphatase